MPEKLFFKPISKTKLKTMEETYKKLNRTQEKVFDQMLHLVKLSVLFISRKIKSKLCYLFLRFIKVAVDNTEYAF